MQPPGRVSGNFDAGRGPAVRLRVLDATEKANLNLMYRKMGVDGVRRHLQTSGWHNALGDPAVRAFAYDWLAQTEARGDRSGLATRLAIFSFVVLLGGAAGYFLYTVPVLSILLETLLQ